MKICIIGGVATGASAAARLRRLDEKAEIIIFERGEYISFANCGLPYHISGKIEKRTSLILNTPDFFDMRFNIEVRVKNEVCKIDRKNKKILVQDIKKGKNYWESYDKLILAPGAEPFIPPIKGTDQPFFKTLRNIPDLDNIISYVKNNKVKDAVIIGGGFIGLEVAENLTKIGIKTTVVEMLNQILAPLDREMANIVHKELLDKGVKLELGDGVKEILDGAILLQSGKTIPTDFVLSAIGVRPEINLAKDADLKIGKLGGVVVDQYLQTSDNNIYAGGDVIQIKNFVTGSAGLIPLAGPANKHGRIIADNLCGIKSTYKDTQGTGILKVFNLQVAFTGISEKIAKDSQIPYEVIHLHVPDHVRYYPGASNKSLKIIFNKKTGIVLGAQGIGPKSVDKTIDVLATAIRAKMTIYDLEELELSYAPPFGAAKDPVNMFGFVGTNMLNHLTKNISFDQAQEYQNPVFLDVREKPETDRGIIPGAQIIPLDFIRDSFKEIPKDRDIIIYCALGIRGYQAYRILHQNGFERIYNLSGGYVSYLHYNFDPEEYSNK